ncbi:imidazolonepropionase [Thermomonas sp.]|uniref:imidazolonepropionase n=1 Tax=Thermomonas sp. TaxID=1971895 RepID=UPI00263599F9|nr:imidazolonepropionase [Thermomonas sp.]
MSESPQWDLLLTHATLATLDGAAPFGLIEDGALACKDGKIAWVGPMAQLPEGATAAQEDDLGGALMTPGLIDCHTHLVFADNRAREFDMRLNGASYADIARAGGGILSSVRALRACSEEALFNESLPRAQALLGDGACTLEIKTGYGLELESERKMLQVARRIEAALGIGVRTSFLGLHALPPEYQGRADDYVEAAIDWLAILHAEGLVDAVDAFCEGIGFTPAQTRRIFAAARELGIPVKLHADQLSDLGGAMLAAEFDGLSADHIEYSNEGSVQAMARHGTVAVLLPGAFHVLRETKMPPVDLLRQHGVPMAVATDCNPGTSPLLSLRQAMQLACTHFRLTPEESLRGATVHAAKALGLSDRGTLRAGLRADLATWDLGHPAELCYWLGGRFLRAAYAAGRRIA